MSKSDFIILIFSKIPEVTSTYFGMIESGDKNAVIAGLLGLMGIVLIAKRLFLPWLKALIGHQL